uniref:Putative secreted histamine binding protein of 33.2 kDa n=1 Tax=Ixodes pacificus TaxID=29930 RepID=Q6B8F8_IXOPA|nr:putative secreted histamine binding protein of 33.2 kDa [Ixodes pacificus]
MGFKYAALFACIATTSAWQAQMTIRNPENNPLLNDPKYGPLQNAWKALERNDSYVLMFRSKNYEPNITCVKVKSTVYNETLKIANYTRTYLNLTSGNTTKLEFQVRALNQSGYELENVIRAGLKGTAPSSTPIPLGSNMYIQYGDYSCNTSSKPFWEMLLEGASSDKDESKTSDPVEGEDYLDFYEVYSQPSCNILRSPFLQGGCDFWLNQSLLADALKHAVNLIQSIDAKAPKETNAAGHNGNGNENNTENKNNEEKRDEAERFAEALFKSLPTACRYAFIASCGYPEFMMYDKVRCKTEIKEPTTTTPSEE